MAAPTLQARAHSGPSYTTLLDSTLRRDRIGFVFQAYNLIPSLDVRPEPGGELRKNE